MFYLYVMYKLAAGVGGRFISSLRKRTRHNYPLPIEPIYEKPKGNLSFGFL